jgi:hypothetical protein
MQSSSSVALNTDLQIVWVDAGFAYNHGYEQIQLLGMDIRKILPGLNMECGQ